MARDGDSACGLNNANASDRDGPERAAKTTTRRTGSRWKEDKGRAKGGKSEEGPLERTGRVTSSRGKGGVHGYGDPGMINPVL